MLYRRRWIAIAATAMLFVSAGCNTPETVSKFCGAATATLAASQPVFADLGGSCLRVKNLEQDFGTFQEIEADPGCDAIAKQSRGAIAAAALLAEYFTALNSLASVGVAKTGANAGDLASQAAGAVGATSGAQEAIGAIAKFLTTAAASSYQTKSLSKDIVAVNGNVASVIDALIAIVQTNYIDQELTDEQRKLAVRYREFAQTHASGDVTLELDTRWHMEQRELAARRSSAHELIEALQLVKRGSAELATQAPKLKAKELPALLEPYIAQLQTMIPQIQKGF